MPKTIVNLLLVVSLCTGGVFCAKGPPWSYDDANGDGPSSWSQSYPTCGGDFQTPIDVNQYLWTSDLTGLQMQGYNQPLRTADLINNGHTAHLSQSGYKATISGGCLDGPYDFHQVHFHWGRDNTRGSEHLLGGKAYPMEGHFVHVKRSYGTVEEALKHPDGLAVLGVFYQVKAPSLLTLEGFGMRPLTNALKKINNYGDKISLSTSMTLRDMMPMDLNHFVCYRNGSLTTPACAETVTWTLLTTPKFLSKDQMAEFRKLRNQDGSPMVDNYRPVQPLNDRVIYGYGCPK